MFMIALSPFIVVPDKAYSVYQTVIESVLEKMAAAGKRL
jgi:hypothetical protein